MGSSDSKVETDTDDVCTWYDIPKTLLFDKIFPYAIESRRDWEDCCTLNTETNDGLRKFILPPWPANQEIFHGVHDIHYKYALSEKYLFIADNKVVDRLGNVSFLPDSISQKQTHHEIVQIGEKYFLAIVFDLNGLMIVQVWDLNDTSQGSVAKWAIPDRTGVAQMKFSQDGSLLAIYQESGVVLIYQTVDWTHIKRLDGRARREHSVQLGVFFCWGRQLLAWRGEQLRIWNLNTYEYADHTLTMGFFSKALLDISTDGSRLAFLPRRRDEPAVEIWKLGPARSLEKLFHHRHAIRHQDLLMRLKGEYETIHALKWSPDGHQLAIGVVGHPGYIYLMEAMTGIHTNRLEVPSNPHATLKIDFSHDSKLLFYRCRYGDSEALASHTIKDIPKYVVEEDLY